MLNTQDILQTQAWAELRESQGHKPYWIDQALMLVKPVQRPFKSIGVMSQVTAAKLNLEALQRLGQELGLSHIQIDPADWLSDFNFIPEIIARYNFKPTESLVPRHTVIIDLSQDLETIKAGMKKNWRYNCGQAEKAGIEFSEQSNEQGLNTFLRLYFDTVSDKGFLGRSPAYFTQVWNVLAKHGKAKIFVTKHQDQALVARMVFIHDGVAYTAYTGTDRHAFPEVKAAYGTMWELIKWAKANNVNYLNLWGVNPEAKEGEKEYGYSQFKIGFGGELVELAPAYDMVISPLAYFVFKLLNSLRLTMLRVKAKLS